MNATDAGANVLAAWRAAGGVAERLDPIERARRSPASRAFAIKAKCFDCVGRGADPGWRWQVGNCTVDCPLVPLRPYQHLLGTPAPVAIAEHAGQDGEQASAEPEPEPEEISIPVPVGATPPPPWE